MGGRMAMIDDEPFVLTNEPARPKLRIDNDDRRQTVMFSGMDCLPGQEELFASEEGNDDVAMA